ncbi:MAG: alpha/beta hydrolase-fold protein [Chitinophagaceae bacterium]
MKQVPPGPINPDIFLAGNMNGWNPADSRYHLKKQHNRFQITLNDLKEGIYQFKFTRGSWENVECKSNGEDMPNRVIRILSDTTLYLTIAGWKDEFPSTPKHHTMSPNVTIIATDFAIPQLHRTRRIWAYLPPDYKTSGKRYPVLYMQDGQNLFDAATAAYGEWGVDEILDSLFEKGYPGIIVIGIDNGGDKRINEYDPYNNQKYGKGEGKKYAAFLAKTLKPFIDKHFRTLPGPENTGIAGSSMGGLISFYSWLKYPKVFGKVGIFSPSFWIAPEIKNDIHLNKFQQSEKLFFIAGDAESQTMVSDMQNIYNDLLQQGMPSANMELKVVPGAQHSETYWSEEFPSVFLWLFDTPQH